MAAFKSLVNTLNATILRQRRNWLDLYLSQATLQERRTAKYFFDTGVAFGRRMQQGLLDITFTPYSPHSDEFSCFVAGFYDTIYDKSAYRSAVRPIDWEIPDER